MIGYYSLKGGFAQGHGFLTAWRETQSIASLQKTSSLQPTLQPSNLSTFQQKLPLKNRCNQKQIGVIPKNKIPLATKQKTRIFAVPKIRGMVNVILI